MKQKLALCCSLIHKPEILILDEPTTGVDAVSRKEFWEMLKRLKDKEITIVVSTPYMDEASLCDRVALIQNGKIMQIETPENIVNQFPKTLWALQSQDMYRLINDMKQYSETESIFAFGQFAHYTDKNDELNIQEIENYLVSKNHTSIIIQKTNPGIEDCFMRNMMDDKI